MFEKLEYNNYHFLSNFQQQLNCDPRRSMTNDVCTNLARLVFHFGFESVFSLKLEMSVCIFPLELYL